MDLAAKARLLRAGYENARYQFIITELELALTFANMAISSNDDDTKRRNTNHAHQAYNAAASHIDEERLDQRRKQIVRSKIRNVNRVFKKLPAL